MARANADTVTSDTNFEHMNWHDCSIHAWSIETEHYDLAMDIDYIQQWLAPSTPLAAFSFLISPATLVFHEVRDISIRVPSAASPLKISRIRRENGQLTPNGKYTDYHWVVECAHGWMEMQATGYTQYLRAAPIRTHSQSLSVEQRGGISFTRNT